MSILLQAQVYASRACVVLGRASRRAREAKAHRNRFYQVMWRKAAAAIGATVEVLDGERLHIARDGIGTKVFRNYTELDSPVTLRMAGDKPYVHAALHRHGIPTPDYLMFSLQTLPAALDFLNSHHICVVKPAAGTGAGNGVTTRVTTRAQLIQAAIAAAAYCSELLIERQISGENIRLLFLDGRLLDAVQRRPPTVAGDGKATIGTLVRKTNQQRLDGGYDVAQVTLKHDLDMQRTLASQGLSWRSVPAAGQSVILKTVVNDNAAAENASVTTQLAESIVAVGQHAARAIGARLAGVDIVTPDLRADLASAGGVVLEINTTPGLYIHYCQHEAPSDVAVPILEVCLELSRQNAGRQQEPADLAVATEGK
jgi:D-alanine-D-alanine ligase-like ATP-grasp enzyme